MEQGWKRRDVLKAAVGLGATALGATAAEAAGKKPEAKPELYPGHQKDIETLQTLKDKLEASQDPAERKEIEIEASDHINNMIKKLEGLDKKPQ